MEYVVEMVPFAMVMSVEDNVWVDPEDKSRMVLSVALEPVVRMASNVVAANLVFMMVCTTLVVGTCVEVLE